MGAPAEYGRRPKEKAGIMVILMRFGNSWAGLSQNDGALILLELL